MNRGVEIISQFIYCLVRWSLVIDEEKKSRYSEIRTPFHFVHYFKNVMCDKFGHDGPTPSCANRGLKKVHRG